MTIQALPGRDCLLEPIHVVLVLSMTLKGWRLFKLKNNKMYYQTHEEAMVVARQLAKDNRMSSVSVRKTDSGYRVIYKDLRGHTVF